jgi:multidrug transporter EmrE-like cation transporter
MIALWLVNIFLDATGQITFKAAAIEPHPGDGLAHWLHMAQRPWMWIGIACYVAEFILWIAFLSLVPLSVGVLLGCINIVAIMLAGRLFFAEKLTPLRLFSILLIAGGVAAVGLP